MKRVFTSAPHYVILFLLFLFISCRQQVPVEQLNSEEFKDPPRSSSIHAWWHWLDNAITKEGITRDLEAMKNQGIVTATVLNVGLFNEPDFGVTQVKFASEEWFSMFEWALNEANRLGMTLGAHNCDGWSSSGGPWINPENSMKRCIWSKSFVEGDREVEIKLPVPAGNMDFYRDIAVVAFQSDEAMSISREENPEIVVKSENTGEILFDGNPFSSVEVKKGTVIDITFMKSVEAERIAIHPRVGFAWGSLHNISYHIDLEVSADGKSYRQAASFEGPQLNKTSILETGLMNSRYFRLDFTDLTGTESIEIAEIELLKGEEKPAYFTEIPFHLEKTVTTMAHDLKDLQVLSDRSTGAVPSGEIIDLTQNMNSEGVFKWDVPAGRWEILRIGYTTTGSMNAPATNAGRGLECDKMDTSALNLHFRSFPAKLIHHAGKFAGNTFEYLFIDSWECGYQNWTRNFPAEFEKRRHYDIIEWLPVICGITVDSPEATEKFLYDYQKTIAELIEENYYSHFAWLCRKNGIKSHAEIIYGGTGYPPIDILKSNSYVDVPMFEFWATPDRETSFINYKPVKNPVTEMPAYAGAIYGKSIIPAEAYTGYANYSENPWDLKLYGDNAFCSGINQMILHSYVHQPFEKKPGITLGIFGQSFNRHNPWWDFASQWFTYHSRVQNTLQKGIPVADILYYVGDRYFNDPELKGMNSVPDGFRIQKCNLDILINHCVVINGRLVLDNGMTYELLLLPDDQYMSLESLKRIGDLVKAGAKVSGPRPFKIPGRVNFEDNEKSLRTMSEEIWGNAGNGEIVDKTYGKGRVFEGLNLSDVLNKLQIKPDFSFKGGGEAGLIYIHKRYGKDDFYFVVNQDDKPVDIQCVFRIKGRMPEIWNPQYGTVCQADNYLESEGTTVLMHNFRPKESLFFVFREGDYSDLQKPFEPVKRYKVNSFDCTVSFEELPEKQPIKIDSFESLVTYKDPDIRYYSGKAAYSISFDLPAELTGHKPLYLSIDSIKTAYEVRMNGNFLGCSAFPGHMFEVTDMAKEKGNNVEIIVAIPYRNRIIGDFIQYGSLKNVWTTSPVNNLPGKDYPLLESGILGPLTFYY